MKGVFIKPLQTAGEVKLLDKWRREYWDADLEVPHDFQTPDGNVDTALAVKNGELLASLTAVNAVVLDPFIKNPNADSTDLLFALVKLETALTYNAQKRGAVDAYIAIPVQLKKYIKLLQNYGWKPTVENCVVLRRPLVPDTVKLLGPERDELLKLAQEAKAAKEAAEKVGEDKNETIG